MLEILLVAAIAVAALVLFVREIFPAEVVAILVLASLATFGLVTTDQALSGFSNAATIAVGAMFVLSAGLRETGALDRLGRTLVVLGVNGPLLLLVTVLSVAALSAFINNTATVAVMLPLVLAAARKRNVSPSKLLIPLSYASPFGGVCTLIGTSTNLLVNSLAVGAGHEGFGLFDFAPVGLTLVGVGTLYLALVGWWLLPARANPGSLEESYALRDYVFAAQVPAESRLVGRTLDKIVAARRGGVRVVELVRGARRLIAEPHLEVAAGDTLLVEGTADELLELSRVEGLLPGQGAVPLEGGDLQLVEIVVAQNSRALGHALPDVHSPWVARAVPIALASRGNVRHGELATKPLVPGDVVLILLETSALPALREDPDFIVLSARSNPVAHARRAPVAIGIVAAVVVMAGSGLAPIAIVALLGAAAMVVT
ncbi:MAG TPA: SLC13 family permease, partial [Xanthomonadales bacterium]|nr:SLC13 family permease [Xanthomonadales bacterium]